MWTRALRDMADRDWHMFTETASRSRSSWTADGPAWIRRGTRSRSSTV